MDGRAVQPESVPGPARAEADVVIVCLSDHSITKQGFVQKEIRFALDIADEHPPGRIFIIPVRLVDCDVPESPQEMAVGEPV